MEEVSKIGDESSLCYIKVKNKALTAENERLKEHFKSFTKNASLVETSSLIADIDRIKDLKAKVKDLESRNDFLNKCDTALNEVLKGELKELKSENSKMKSERIGSKPYYQSINKYVNKIKELVANNTDLKVRVNDLNSINDWLNRKEIKTKGKVDDLTAENTELEAEIKELKRTSRLIADIDRIKDLKAKVKDLEDTNNWFKEIQQINASLRSETADLKTENERLNEILEESVKGNGCVISRQKEEISFLATCNKELKLLKSEYDQSMNKYENKIKELKARNEALEGKYEADIRKFQANGWGVTVNE